MQPLLRVWTWDSSSVTTATVRTLVCYHCPTVLHHSHIIIHCRMHGATTNDSSHDFLLKLLRMMNFALYLNKSETRVIYLTIWQAQ